MTDIKQMIGAKTTNNDLGSLFADWKQISGADHGFTEDGIIDPGLWHTAAKKVLFVLKEPGQDPTEIFKPGSKYYGSNSLLDLYREWNGARYSFNYLGAVAYGLQNATKNSYPTYQAASIRDKRDKAFLGTAFMNLKKVPTLRADRSTDTAALEKYVREYPQFIVRQIQIMGPDIVVCCGDVTSEFLGLAIDLTQSRAAVKELVFMKTCHPTARQWRNDKGVVRRKKADGYADLLGEYLRVEASL